LNLFLKVDEVERESPEYEKNLRNIYFKGVTLVDLGFYKDSFAI